MKWKSIKLSECCESISDGDHQAPPKSDCGIPFVTIANINQHNQFDFQNTMFVPREYYDCLDDKRKPQPDDILYSVVGSFGIPVFMKHEAEFVFQRHIAILRPSKEISPKFLYYVMLSREFYMQADSVAIGAAQRTISLTSLRNMEIKLPPIETQHRIANILFAYDDLIENNQKQIKLLEEAAQRLYKEWFVDLHFPGHENTKIVDGVPEGWSKNTVDCIVKLQSGYPFKSKDFDEHGTYKIVTIKNVQDGVFEGNNTSRIINIPSNMPLYCNLHDGDILLSLTGNIGRICRVSGDHYLLNQRVAKLESAYSGFAYCLFRSDEMFHNMNALANGAAQQNLSPIRTEKIQVLIPNVEILLKFEKICTKLFCQMSILTKQSNALMEARDRLLPKLMSGELEV